MFLPAPETGLLCLALAAAVVRIPLLAPEALVGVVGKAAVHRFVSRRFTSVVAIAKKYAIPEDSFLSLLIFKIYQYPPDFGLRPLVQKSDEVGHLEVISLFNLSFENVIIQIRVYSCDACLKFYFLTLICGGLDITT